MGHAWRGGALIGGILLNRNYTTRNPSFGLLLLSLSREYYTSPAIHSPFSHLTVSSPTKCPTLYESETAEALLNLFSPRLGTLDLPDHDYTMNVSSEIQALTSSDLGVAEAYLSLMPQDSFRQAALNMIQLSQILKLPAQQIITAQ